MSVGGGRWIGQRLLAATHQHDDGRRDAGVEHQVAVLAAHAAFDAVPQGGLAAAAAKAVRDREGGDLHGAARDTELFFRQLSVQSA